MGKDGALTQEEVQQVMDLLQKCSNNGNNINSAKIIFPYRYLGIGELSL